MRRRRPRITRRHRRDVVPPRRLGNWLKAFQDHAHLDSNSPRRFPGTYDAAFGQLNKPFQEYLVDLGTAEKEVVQIEVAPRRRLSAPVWKSNFTAPFAARRSRHGRAIAEK